MTGLPFISDRANLLVFSALVIGCSWTPAHSATRFVPVAQGSEIRDTQTGLTWRRCTEGQTWTGSTCTGDPLMLTWAEALTHARSESTTSGRHWRVPNIKELSSLIDYARERYQVGDDAAAIDPVAFPNTPYHVNNGQDSLFYWSSTPGRDAPGIENGGVGGEICSFHSTACGGYEIRGALWASRLVR